MSKLDENIRYYCDDTDYAYSLNQLRLYAFLYVPADAPSSDVYSWLVAGGIRLSKEVRDVVCRIHEMDSVLSDWRMLEEPNSSDECESVSDGALTCEGRSRISRR